MLEPCTLSCCDADVKSCQYYSMPLMVGDILSATVCREKHYGVYLTCSDVDIIVLAPGMSWTQHKPADCFDLIGRVISVKLLRYVEDRKIWRASIKDARSDLNDWHIGHTKRLKRRLREVDTTTLAYRAPGHVYCRTQAGGVDGAARRVCCCYEKSTRRTELALVLNFEDARRDGGRSASARLAPQSIEVLRRLHEGHSNFGPAAPDHAYLDQAPGPRPMPAAALSEPSEVAWLRSCSPAVIASIRNHISTNKPFSTR